MSRITTRDNLPQAQGFRPISTSSNSAGKGSFHPQGIGEEGMRISALRSNPVPALRTRPIDTRKPSLHSFYIGLSTTASVRE